MVIAACRRAGVKRLVHTSTPSVLFSGRDLEGVDESTPYPPRWHSPYAATKAAAEQQVLQAAADGLPAIVLRPHEIWGPGDPHFVPRILARAHRLRRIGDGNNLIDTTYIDNAAQAHLLAADRLGENPGLSGRVYFISQGEPVPAWEMIDAILKAAGRGPVKGRISHRSAWLAGWACELIYRGLRLAGEPPLTRFVADALARTHWFDIGAARRDLGYAPAVSTAEGLRRLEIWLTPHGKDPL
jgi:nucleoside-diphosphate-sugar epimerase